MDRKLLETLGALLGGAALIGMASHDKNKTELSPKSDSKLNIMIAQSMLNEANGNAELAVQNCKRKYGEKLPMCNKISAIIYELSKQREGSKSMIFWTIQHAEDCLSEANGDLHTAKRICAQKFDGKDREIIIEMIERMHSDRKGSKSMIFWAMQYAEDCLSQANGDVVRAKEICMQSFPPKYHPSILDAIEVIAKQGSSNRERMFRRAPNRQDVQTPNRQGFDFDTVANIQEVEDPNPQRYRIFWDCVTRHVNPQDADPRHSIIAEDGGFYGELLRHNFMCFHNENDNKWSNCSTAAALGLNHREPGILTFADLMRASEGNGNLTGYECVLAAMPVDDNGEMLPPELGMPLRKVFVAAAYMDAGTAIQNWNAALPLIRTACTGGDIFDLDDYMRT